MKFLRALMFSFAGHFFCLAFFTFSYDACILKSENSLSVDFLGAILNQSEVVTGKFSQPFAGPLPFKKSIFPKQCTSGSFDKPMAAARRVSGEKRLNKFLVLDKGVVEKEGYQVSPPAWEKVDLKLKIE